MTVEFATVEGNDIESITCVCGNTCSDEGMIAATPEGIAVHISSITPTPKGLAPYPEDIDDIHTLCPVCGRVYSDKFVRQINTSRDNDIENESDELTTHQVPVAFQVDVTDGTRYKNAIIAHWDELN